MEHSQLPTDLPENFDTLPAQERAKLLDRLKKQRRIVPPIIKIDQLSNHNFPHFLEN